MLLPCPVEKSVAEILTADSEFITVTYNVFFLRGAPYLKDHQGNKRGGESVKWVTAQDLQRWADTIASRSDISQLVSDLIRASVTEISSIRFPTGDASQMRGWDGHLVLQEHHPTFQRENRAGSSERTKMSLLRQIRTMKAAFRRQNLSTRTKLLSFSSRLKNGQESKLGPKKNKQRENGRTLRRSMLSLWKIGFTSALRFLCAWHESCA